MQNVYIQAFGISGYRSFGPEPELFPHLKKINLIIGQNNSGKSNVLRFLKNHYVNVVESCMGGKSRFTFKDLDSHIGGEKGGNTFCIGMPMKGSGYEERSEEIKKKIHKKEVPLTIIDNILRSLTLAHDEDTAWFRYDTSADNRMNLADSCIDEVQNRTGISDHKWRGIFELLTGMGGGSLKDWIKGVLELLSPIDRPVPHIAFIEAIREVGPAGGDKNNFSGLGLIDMLAQLQNPRYSEQFLKDQFENINIFLQTVTANPTARIEIPADRDTILAHIDGITLPLSSLGTGIHEVIILAAAASILTNRIICIEEPEIHLHPTLQKKLIQHLNSKTSNQYFIATHSAHLLDASCASVYHVTQNNGCSHVNYLQSATDKCLICSDLGYRASDLLQSNCIIWVEGPSDRIYLRHWISGVSPDLIEGIHFSIMFYGGRLLSHLSAHDPEIDDFISLRRLNRHMIIIIDSDRSKPRDRLNETKKRIEKEFETSPGFAWVTKGREIENYVPGPMIKSAIQAVHNDVKEIGESDIYNKALEYINRKHECKTADKVKIAQHIASQPANLDILDLKEMTNKTVAFIKAANGFG